MKYKPADYTYIGKQIDEEGNELHLFNCLYYNSTISDKYQKQHLKQFHLTEWVENVLKRRKKRSF